MRLIMKPGLFMLVNFYNMDQVCVLYVVLKTLED